MNNFCAALATLDLAVRGDALARRKAVFHACVEIEETHSKHAAAVADLTHHHAASAKSNVAVQHFAFHRGPNARQQIVNGVELGAIFVAQRQVQQ